ncbi:MAG TPA: hypothetical protein VHJ69_05365 [Gemmatimonadales bacterium]|jgi:hypothetical protein|nr:hypothetical protein [Gemmatimonadales bacterium]
MQRAVLTLAFAGSLALSACALTQSGQESRNDTVSDDSYPETASTSTSVSELARTACRDEIVRRWHVDRARVRTSSRSTNWEGETLVDWQVDNGGAGYCRVDAKGNVNEFKVERDQGDSNGDFDDDDFNRYPSDTGGLDSREVRSSQIQACRDEVIRRFDVRPSEVGTTAGELDDRQMAYIEWKIQGGRSGTCLVDSDDTVVRFRTR